MITTVDDLRALIRQHAGETPDPAVITGRILDGLTGGEALVVVGATLHDYVRHAIRTPMPPAPLQTYSTADGAQTVSRKVAAIRDWVTQRLAAPVCVDESARRWLFLGDCTADDLTAAAEIRHRKAAQTTAEAEWLERLAKVVAHADAGCVRELPVDVLETALRR